MNKKYSLFYGSCPIRSAEGFRRLAPRRCYMHLKKGSFCDLQTPPPASAKERPMTPRDNSLDDHKSHSERLKSDLFTKRLRFVPLKRVLPRKLMLKPQIGPAIRNPFQEPYCERPLRKPDPSVEIRKRQMLIAMSPNVFDLSSYRKSIPAERPAIAPVAKKPEAPIIAIRCTVVRPGNRIGKWKREQFEFVSLPARGDEITLRNDTRFYVARSIMHWAVEPGCGQPFVQIRLRVKKR
jgi:hypothetical protein